MRSCRLQLALLLAAVLVAFALDGVAYRSLSITDPAALAAIQSKDWHRLLRIAGYWPTWALGGVLVLLCDHAAGRANWPRRGVFLLLSTGAAGLVAEVVKPLVGRMRPEDTAGALRFMPWGDRWTHWSDLSMASSHAAVAFAGAFATARLWPGSGPVLLLLTAGCGLTRILAGAHFLSDVAAGGLIGWFAAWALYRLDARNNAGRPLASAGPVS